MSAEGVQINELVEQLLPKFREVRRFTRAFWITRASKVFKIKIRF